MSQPSAHTLRITVTSEHHTDPGQYSGQHAAHHATSLPMNTAGVDKREYEDYLQSLMHRTPPEEI